MSFQAPLYLLGLLAVPALLGLLVLARRRRRRFVVRFPALGTLRVAAAEVPAWRRHLPLALFLAAVAGLVVGLARPTATVAVAIERASVMLVTDTSGSMEATDVAPTRLEAARRSANEFLDKVPDDLQVGAIAYADTPYLVEQPTDDHDAVRDALDTVSARGATATGDALSSALGSLREVRGRGGRRAPSAIVLLSDGKTTRGRDPVRVAEQARALGIPIYTVALGTPSGTLPTPGFGVLPVPPDPETLREIARVSGGQAFTAEESDELERVYERLGSRLGTRREQRELTAGFAGGGALLLAGALFGAVRRQGRLP
jgi:Ca-activated chloride channel family protein